MDRRDDCSLLFAHFDEENYDLEVGYILSWDDIGSGKFSMQPGGVETG